jgi:uncharacterized protein (DUF433 family)
MGEEKIIARITINSKIMGGKPVISGTRLTVQYILKALADGITAIELIQEYEGLILDDISACLLYAAKAVDNIAYLPSIEGLA